MLGSYGYTLIAIVLVALCAITFVGYLIGRNKSLIERAEYMHVARELYLLKQRGLK